MNCQAQSIPSVKAKALDDSEVILRKSAGQQLLILILGFSHKSGEACRAWSQRVAADYGSDPHATYFQLAGLESAPSFGGGMIVKNMRKGVPPAQQSRFVPLFEHQEDWKKAANFSAPEDAYVLISFPAGRILWRTRGTVTDASYTDRKGAVARFVAQKSYP
jgi:hypothetical protein